MTEGNARPDPAELDLRVAEVIEAKDHPDADRLHVLRIDLGGEERQIVAGLVGHYEPGELEGKRIVVVANLEPADLRGEVSEGMLLAAESGDELGLLLAPDAEPGTRLRPASGREPADSISFSDFQEHGLVADEAGVSVDGEPLEGADLVMDRGIFGRLR